MANARLRDEPSNLRRVTLALATLSLVGFSLVLAFQMSWLTLDLRTDFAEHNSLGVPARLRLLLSLAAALSVPALTGVLVLWRKRDIATLERAATLSAPLGLAFMIPGLFLSQVASEKPLFYLIVLAVFGSAFRALLADAMTLQAEREPGRLRSLGVWRRIQRFSLPAWLPLPLLMVCGAGFAYLLVSYGLGRHRLIQDVANDVAVADNVMCNLLHGRWFTAPAQFGTVPGSYLSLHAEYGALLFVPFYALRPGMETMLWMQASIAALAVIPLYLLAARKLGPKLGLWLGLGYLLLAPLHGALIAGFTWLPAVTLFAFTLYYAIESERLWLLVVSLLGLLSISEAGPLYVLALGITLLASRARPRLGLLLSALAVPVIAFNLWLSVRGKSALEVPPLALALLTLCRNPVYFFWDLARFSKVASVLHALAPLCLLPVLELSCWPLLLPGLLFTAAGSAFWPNGSANFVNCVVWVPGCFIALVLALEKRRVALARPAAYVAAVVTLSITQLSHSYNFGAFLRADGFGGLPATTVRMTPWGQSRYDSLKKALALIPPSASVGATTYLLSFVSNRTEAYDLSRPHGLPDYVLLSSREAFYVHAQLMPTFASHKYKLVLSNFDEFYLFVRSAETPETRAVLTRLGF